MGAPLTATTIFDTGAVEFSNEPGTTTGTQTWMPNTSIPLYIRLWQTWIGVDWNGKADISAMVTVVGQAGDGFDGNLVAYTAWDHYTNPAGYHHDRLSFSPDYIVIPAYGGLKLSYLGTAFPDPTHVHIKGTLWFSLQP